MSEICQFQYFGYEIGKEVNSSVMKTEDVLCNEDNDYHGDEDGNEISSRFSFTHVDEFFTHNESKIFSNYVEVVECATKKKQICFLSMKNTYKTI